MAAAELAAAAGEETEASSAESPDTSPENVRREEGEAAAVGEDKQEAKGKITTVHLRILHYITLWLVSQDLSFVYILHPINCLFISLISLSNGCNHYLSLHNTLQLTLTLQDKKSFQFSSKTVL